MAQKRYSFDFVLNAVLNGGFSGTFTKAQQEFVRLGTEIKNLQAIQRDVKAYEKQAAAVQNTEKRLGNLTRQQELLSKQIGETKGSTTALEREELKLQQRIDNTTAALEKQKARLGETENRLDAAGISTSDLAGKDAELTAKIHELTEEQKKAAEGAGEFGSAGAQAIEAVSGAIAGAGIAGAMKGIADAYMECVGIAGDFEQAMSAVEAIADSNASEMSALTAQAKELGATTRFTAQQSANAMEYMAMAGWDAQEMLSGMSGVVSLAAAANEDLAQVSDIVTDNLSAFGLKASDTAHFSDVLAAAAAKSNTNVAIMGETFKNSSSVAGALGYSVEDVAVMVGLMANNAVKGSRAGTALRNIFNGLLGGVTLTAEAFGELKYSAVNSDGSMKGLMETVKDLRGYFDEMTEAERVNNAMAIAGMRGYNGLLAILNATDEDFQSLYASINGCSGAAERMAQVKLDNLNGDITIMNSAMEALQSTVGEQFNPELRELTQLGTESLNWVNQFIQENPALTKGAMAGMMAFGGLGTAIVGVNAAMKVFHALNLAALFTGPAGVLLAVAAGIAGVTAAVVGFAEATRDGGQAVRELTEAARELDTAMEEAKASYEDTTASTLAAADVANYYIDKLEEMGDASQLSDEEQKRYQNTLALLLQVMPSLSDCISQTADEYGRTTYALNTTTEALRANTEEWKRSAKERAYQEYLNSLMEKYNDVMLEAAENEIGLTSAKYKLEDATKKQAAITERMDELWAEANAEAQRQYEEYGILKNATWYLTQEYYSLEAALFDVGYEMRQAQESVTAHERAIARDEEAVAAAEAEMEAAEKAARGLLDAMGDFGKEPEGVAAVREALDGTMEKVQELTDAYKEAYEEAAVSFSGQFGLFEEARADAEATVEAAQAALDSQLAYWQGYAESIQFLKDQSAESLNLTQENYDALMAYIRSGTPEAVALAADMVEKINNGNIEAITTLGNTVGEVNETIDQAAQDMADWTSGLTEQMGQLIDDMEEEIGALDMSEEAAESGRATVQAYINQMASMLPQVRGAYADVARAAYLVLFPEKYRKDVWYAGENRGYSSGTDNALPGWAWVGENGPELMRMHGGEQILPSSVSREAVEDYSAYVRYVGGNRGYAGGTDNALPGWAWVGEAGPELMRMRGGRQAFPGGVFWEAAEDYSAYKQYTAAQGVQAARPPLEVARTGGETGRPKMDLHFHIEAGALPETVNAWQDYANRGELKAVVLEVIEEADADRERRMMR